MSLDMFLQHCFNALTLGSLYALIAIGYTMVYGILRLINSAHGDVFMVAGLMARTGQGLAETADALRRDHPSSGEINFTVPDTAAMLQRVRAALVSQARSEDWTDGLSLDFRDWRLNLRASNTEPLLRLNVEARGDPALVAAGVARVRGLIEA